MTLPNFLIIGAAKSGTTALYFFLKQHPEIFMSTPKELRYFSYMGEPPDELPKKYIHQGVVTLDAYEKHFDDSGAEKIIGEASPMYLYVPGTAERIKATIPNVKLLAILRNPVDRAYSAFTHALRDWSETETSFQAALNKEVERIEAGWDILWHYTQAGFYYNQISRYYNFFNKDQIKVVLYDDLVEDAQGLCQHIFEYLEVKPDFTPDTSKRPNISGFPRSTKFHQFMNRLFMYDNPIKKLSRQLFPKSFRQKVMVNLRIMNMEKREMPEEAKNYLKNLFKEDIKQLEDLIERDLSSWTE
jgi:hypothetical protein